MAVLMAVMICRVMQSSANALKEASLSPLKVSYRLVESDHAFLDDILAVGPDQKIGTRFRPDKILDTY